MNKLQALYNKLSSDGLYTKSFEEFQQQFSNPSSQQALYNKLSSDGLYTKSSEEFQEQFFSNLKVVKKKDGTESLSEDGLSDSQRKSKEIFEQIGAGFQRLPNDGVELTEQSIAQMESPVDESLSRRDIGTIQSADFTGDRFDIESEKEIQQREIAEPTQADKDRRAREIMFATAKRDSPETEKAVSDDFISDAELEEYKERKEDFDEWIDESVRQGKREKILQYNIVASEQGLEPISEIDYARLFEDDEKSAEDLDREIYDEIYKQLEGVGLTKKEVDAIDEKNRELVANGQEPVGYDFYINQKKNNLFNEYVRSKGALPSQRKEAIIQSIIEADARVLAPSSYGDIFDTTVDLTQGLDDKTRLERSEEINKNKLKRNFIVTNISPDKFLKNANKVLTNEAYAEVEKEANQNFYNDYGEQEWDVYTKISGNADPTLIGSEYENANQDNSLVNQAVVINDQDATVENLNSLFPNSSFRFKATGIKDDYVTISTVSPDGEVVKALEIYLGEDNDPARRVREFMQGALLNKKDKAFLNKQYDYEDPLWRLEMYDYMLSNPQKFGEKGSPAMYGTERAYETVDFKEIGDYLDRHKDNISDEMMEAFRMKMAQADAYYSGELAQKGTLATALTSGFLTGLSAPSRFVSNQIANVADAFGAEGAKEAKDGVISAIESAQEQISGTTAESIAERNTLQTVINTMASSGTAMALGMGNPYATFGSFLMQSSPATERLLKDEDIPEYQKGLISIMMGTVEGALETYGAQTLLTPSSKGVFKRLIIDSIKDLPSDAPQEVIERAIKNSVRAKLKSGALQVAQSQVIESITELQQSQIDDLNKRLFNAIYEKEIFQVPDWTTEEGRKQWADMIIESAVLGALSGGGFAVTIHGTKSLAQGFQTKADNKRFNKTYEEVMNNSTFEKAKTELKLARSRNEITEKELEVLTNQLDESRAIMQSIPETLTTNRKRQAYNLLTEKRALERSMQNKSPELVASQKDRIKSIDAQLKIVGNEEVAETADVVEEFVKGKPSRMERVTRYQEIDNIMKPEQVETTTEKIVREEAPVTEQVVEEAAPVVEEAAPVVEEAAPVVEEAPATEQLTEAQQEAQLLAQQLEGTTQQQPTEQVTEQPTGQALLDEQWNNELQENKDAQLEAAEQQLKEEKGPGRRRMLVGRRQAPVITQEEILQRAKENLNEQITSLQEEEVSPTTPTEEVEVVQGDDVVTNKPITINYNRNPESAPDMGTQFGQDVEAAGTYITQKQGDFTPEGFQTGTVTINNPLVIEVNPDTQIEYKRKLSEENDGKTGVELSNALREKGFDAIVTKNEDGTTGEIVLLKDISATESPQFRTKKVQEKVAKETADEVQDIVDDMNKMESGNVGTNLDTTEEGVTINTQELNERTDNELPTITNLQIIDGIPTIFTISDQLTTGSVVNPRTGNTIDNLRGGLGFTGTEGNQNAAWANTTEKEATDIINKAFKTYEQNKEVFHKWWKANPEFSGHIPMSVVKMGEGSILSNEATFRVLRDNLTKIPVKNRKNAVKLLRKSILDKIKKRQDTIKSGVSEKTGKPLTDLTIRNYKKEITGHKETLKTLAKVNPKSIDDIVSQEFIETLSLPARRTLIEQITFGQPNRAGERKAPSKSDKAVPAALIEGMTKEALELVHLGPITDLITEPQLKDVPQRSIIALQAVEIGDFNAQTNELTEINLDESILNTKHPNYAFGTKGKTIGIVENPISVVRAYPQAFANAMSGLAKVEKKGKKMTKDKFKRLTKKEQETAPKPGELDVASVGTILTETLGVQNGLPNEEFIGAIAQQNITKEQQLIAFMNESFPGVVISTDQETFDNVMNSEGINKKFVEGKVVYGVTKDGDIYINPEVHNTESELYNTAIHEMGHVWQTYLQTSPKGQKIYKRGVELVKQTDEYQRQLEIFDGNEAKAAHEAMAVLIGNKGETIAEAATKSKFKEWLLSMWKYIQSKFKMSKDVKVSELQDMTLDDFLGMALADIFSGKPVRGKNARSLTKLKNPEVAFSASQSMQDVIIHGRNNGFSDAAIKIYLQSQGYTVAEIKDALTINRDLFDNTFPAAFANVPGGVNEGTKMYDRTLKKIKKYIRQNNPSLQQIQEQAQVFLKRDNTFKTYNDTLQQSLLIALNSSLEINQSSEVAADIKRMKETLKQRRKGAKELSSLQTQLRVFLRKNFPRTQWESKEVIQLITEVTNAKFYKDFENLAVKPDNDIRMVMDKVSKVVMQKRVDDSIKKINKRLSIKTQKLEGGRKKGVNFLPEAVERIQQINEDLAIDPVNYNKIDRLQARLRAAVRKGDQELIDKIQADLDKLNANATTINEKIESLRREFEELSEKNEITDEIAKRMHDIDIAILYNEALLMENDNPNKADTLVQVDGLIKNMLSLERDAYNEVIRQAKERYNRLKSEFLEDVSGVEVDYNSEESVREGKKKVNDRSRVKNKQTARKILNYLLSPTSMIMKRIESVEGLVSRISKGQGEMFGGKSAEIIGDRLNESRRTYKGGKREMNAILKKKAEEIFGDNYVKVTERNQRRNVKIILDKAKHDKLVEQQKKAKTKREKRELQREIDTLVEYFSQNEMYYLYNQNKDAANRPGLASKKEFAGYNINEIMEDITSKLDPKVKQWADWQVNEFFPSVYQRYNDVYKKIYRTNMPWNANYAGRVVREDMTQDPQDIMSMQNQYRTNVGSQSSMIRIQNSNPIKTVSGDNMLNQYIDEMEYFRGYGESMRDISKIYNDPLIKQAIITYTDKDTYNVLRGQLEKVIQRRNAKLTADHPVFTASTSAFAISKLGLNPTVMLKQMTSSLAFADYIGYRNWAMYAGIESTKGFGKWNTTWQEMYENSPELQDRYSRDDFAEAIETYQPEQQNDLLGGRQIAGLGKSDFNKYRNFLMYMVKTGDMGGVMGSIPNYAYYKDQYKQKNPNATEQQAIDFAIRKTVPQILSTQQSSDIQDKDHFSTDSAVMRSLQLFTSSPRALFRKEMYAIREIYRKMYKLAQTGDVKASLIEEGKGTLKENIRTFVTYHFIVPMFFKYISLGLPGLASDWDDDEDWDELFGARQLLLGNIESVFIIGDLLAGVGDAIQEKPWAGELRSIPLLDEASGILKNYVKYNQSKTPETKEKYLDKFKYGLFNLLGIPVKQIGQGIDNYIDIGKGDYNGFGEFMLKLLNYSDYVQEGGAKKESSGGGGGGSSKSKLGSKLGGGSKKKGLGKAF